jgi:hypothetical protein
MKTKIILLAFTLSLSSVHAEINEPPSLSLTKAASIAEAKLIELKLPAEYYLRSIRYFPISHDDAAPHYLAVA